MKMPTKVAVLIAHRICKRGMLNSRATKLRKAALTACACFGVSPGTALQAGTEEGDVELGEYLSAECVTCHQSNADTKGIPQIVGLDTEAFVDAMLAYKTKQREHPIMQMMAGRLNDEEIAALAAYFYSLK